MKGEPTVPMVSIPNAYFRSVCILHVCTLKHMIEIIIDVVISSLSQCGFSRLVVQILEMHGEYTCSSEI